MVTFVNAGSFEAEDELDKIQAALVQVPRAEAAGDELHNQLLTLPATPPPVGFEQHGTPQFLAARTAQWFGGLLRRPGGQPA